MEPSNQEPLISEPASLPAASEQARIASSAGIIALGSIASRILGVVREAVITYFFGATGLVSAFRVASIVPTMLYDLLIGGNGRRSAVDRAPGSPSSRAVGRRF